MRSVSYWSSSSDSESSESRILSSLKQRMARNIHSKRSTRSARGQPYIAEENIDVNQWQVSSCYDTSSWFTNEAPWSLHSPRSPRSPETNKAFVLLGIDMPAVRTPESRSREANTYGRQQDSAVPALNLHGSTSSKAQTLPSLGRAQQRPIRSSRNLYLTPISLTTKKLPELPYEDALSHKKTTVEWSSLHPSIAESIAWAGLNSPEQSSEQQSLQLHPSLHDLLSSECEERQTQGDYHQTFDLRGRPGVDHTDRSSPTSPGAQYFGMGKAEIGDAPDNLQQEEVSLSDLTLWYDGYGFGEHEMCKEKARMSADSATILLR